VSRKAQAVQCLPMLRTVADGTIRVSSRTSKRRCRAKARIAANNHADDIAETIVAQCKPRDDLFFDDISRRHKYPELM
jgi:hypothetical protein